MDYQQAYDNLSEEERAELREFASTVRADDLVNAAIVRGERRVTDCVSDYDIQILAKLSEIIARRTPATVLKEPWRPDEGEEYHAIDWAGNTRSPTYRADSFDAAAIALCNCHRTEDIAAEKRDRVAANMRHWELIEAQNDGERWPAEGKDRYVWCITSNGVWQWAAKKVAVRFGIPGGVASREIAEAIRERLAAEGHLQALFGQEVA